jgi:heme-degrading monooxygenase HmoA
MGQVSIVRINALTVPADSGEELARRFAARAGAVDDAPGFEGFELLRPTDDRTTWLVVTRWADAASFEAWLSSAAFGAGHRGAGAPSGGPAGGGAHGAGADGSAPARPVASGSEVWAYEVVDLS